MTTAVVQPLPPVLSYLDDRGYVVRRELAILGHRVFLVDLSELRLRLSHINPVIQVSDEDMLKLTPRQLVESLQDVMRAPEFGDAHLIALVLLGGGPDKLAQDVRRSLPKTLNNMVVIDAQQQRDVLNSRTPTGALLDIISAQTTLARLAPYEIKQPVTGSRFFGRDYEIAKIIDNPDHSYTLLGIRRIGKTSVLHEVQRRLLDRDPAAPVFYIDCSDFETTYDYALHVIRNIEPREIPRMERSEAHFAFSNFLERMRKRYKRRLVFLLDEIDNLIIRQWNHWELFNVLRKSSLQGSCRYVIAGFRDAMNARAMLDSPFHNFTDEIRLREFQRQVASDLITIPMENLRVRFRNKDQVVNRIYDETSGQPNLIQYYCSVLIQRMDQSGSREISIDSLIDVYRDDGFRDQLISTFMANTDTREKAVVYAILLSAKRREDLVQMHFSQAHIDQMLKQQRLTLRQEAIDAACRSLVLAGVFSPHDKTYTFTSPVFPKVLKESNDIGYLLMKTREAGI